jgi:SAM-dependent methyltransferase
MEGFTQIEPFVLKQNNEIYDDFYSDIYDSLHNTKKRIQPELIEIIQMTEPSTNNSVFLDVGSGTGNMVAELVEAGFDAYGIEKSNDMISCTKKQFPEIEIVHADVLDSMMFEKGTFTHILCTYFTIYNFKNKEKFFRNCYYWMKPNSYLILHLVHPQKFKQIIPFPNTEITIDDNSNSNSRILKNRAIFDDFEYNACYDIPNQDENHKCMCTEMFTDINTNHIRQNEQTLYMESIDYIINLASLNGFIIKGKSNMNNGDSNQFLYILERHM